MKELLALLLVLFSLSAYSQDVKVLTFNQLSPLLNKESDTTWVVNFWATWCLPCVKELPHFQKLHDDYSSKKLKVLLVSLDFEKHLETRLLPFIQKNNITPEVILLNAPDANAWIDKVDTSWSGALPATLIFNRQVRKFYEQSFTYEELSAIINQTLIE